MTLQEAISEKVRLLPADAQEKVLQFVQSLEETRNSGQHKDPKGMFAHRGIHLTAEEIDEARREAWAGFPRDFPEKDSP